MIICCGVNLIKGRFLANFLCDAWLKLFAIVSQIGLYMHMLMESNYSPEEMHEVFERVSNYFALLAEPMRLKILYTLCNGERAVADIVERTGSTQANVSRHLNMLYRAKVLARRKDGTQVYYRILDKSALKLCKTVCAEITSDIEQRPKLIDKRLKKSAA